MTIFELEDTLPSGFHDALLHGYFFDLVGQTARLDLEISVGDPDASSQTDRDAYRPARVLLEGVEYFIVERPDPRYGRNAPWMVALCDGEPAFAGVEKRFAARLYSTSTNSFIHFSARHATITYRDGS
ncbi:MAG TPA: hypothetical protein VGO11_05920 [Chthoniobacteraceae bacterium]|jgi:hypothetical protein|nr:hypothetical protein [Chthoniobacteraceae bacterium]